MFSGGIERTSEMKVLRLELFPSQSPFTSSKSTIETLEHGVKYVQSLQ